MVRYSIRNKHNHHDHPHCRRNHCENEQRVAKAFDQLYGEIKGPMMKFIEADELEHLVDRDRPDVESLMPKAHVTASNEGRNTIAVLPSPQPVPVTTSGMIGWRCANPDYWLDWPQRR